jgi:endonuclease III
MEVIREVLTRLPGRFSTELGIEVAAGPEERQKWFLAAVLFGARISGQLAARTYRVFAAAGVLTPQAFLKTGWDGLVALLDEGGYARYDFKTATKLLTLMESLERDYDGDLDRLAAAATDPRDLEQRLMALGKGVGPATVNIFLRELRDIWPLARPPLSPLAQLAAEHLQLLPPGLDPQAALAVLQERWQTAPVPGFVFADLEAALVRLGRDFCRKARLTRPCPLAAVCGRGPESLGAKPKSSPKSGS